MEEDSAHCVWCQTWPGGTGFYKNSGWTGHGKQILSTSLHDLCIISCLYVPCMNHCPEFTQWRIIIWCFKSNKPFPSELALWLCCFIRAIGTLRQVISLGVHYQTYFLCNPFLKRKVLLGEEKYIVGNFSPSLFYDSIYVSFMCV